MNVKKRIRVLIIDDSILFREVLSKGISADPGIEIAALAGDPFDARDKIIQYEPDVITCDIEMPKMNGIEFIQRLIPQYPIPVIVVSTVSDAVFHAMNAGAVDFVAKPDMKSAKSLSLFINDLIIKIKIAAAANVCHLGKEPCKHLEIKGKRAYSGKKLIVMGASTGGTEALYYILRLLPPSVPGIIIVQHIPPVFSGMFAERLNKSTSFQVKEAESGEYAERGRVLIAPGDKHIQVKRNQDKFSIEVFTSEKVNGHRPSVDVLFESAANECGSEAVGVILTGMGYDGAKGLLLMRRNGAATIGQDEKSSVVYGMPRVAYNIGAVEKQVPLELIPHTIVSMLG